MKTIRNWQDASAIGVHCLTGEACALMLRLLCDLDPAASEAVAALFGVRVDDLRTSWNHGDKEAGWRSAQFMPTTLNALATWICRFNGIGYTICEHETFVVFDNEKEYNEAKERACRWWCVNCSHTMGHDRNTKPFECEKCGRAGNDLHFIPQGSWSAFGKSWSKTSVNNKHQFIGRQD